MRASKDRAPVQDARGRELRRLLATTQALRREIAAMRVQAADLAAIGRTRRLNSHEREVERHLADRLQVLQREFAELRDANRATQTRTQRRPHAEVHA